MKVEHPWQKTPAELIALGLEYLRRSTDFDKSIAFLLLDVGVETLFKTFLTLPEEVTAAKGSYSKRSRAAKGNDSKPSETAEVRGSKLFEPAEAKFHVVVQGIKEAAGDQVKDFDLDHVLHYHRIRNRLYHEGDGVTATTENADEYARLAVGLLKALLDVDLSDELHRPEREARAKAESDASLKAMRGLLAGKDQTLRHEASLYRADIELFIEHVAPRLLMPSFRRKLQDICARYGSPHTYCDKDTHYEYCLWPPDVGEVATVAGEFVSLLQSAVPSAELRQQMFAPVEAQVFDKGEMTSVRVEAVVAYLLDANVDVGPVDLYLSIADILGGQKIPPWLRCDIGWPPKRYPGDDATEAETLEGETRRLDEALAELRETRLRFELWFKEYAETHPPEP